MGQVNVFNSGHFHGSNATHPDFVLLISTRNNMRIYIYIYLRKQGEEDTKKNTRKIESTKTNFPRLNFHKLIPVYDGQYNIVQTVSIY